MPLLSIRPNRRHCVLGKLTRLTYQVNFRSVNAHVQWEPPFSPRPGGAKPSNLSMCVATSHWAGYPMYQDDGSGAMTRVAVGIFDALSGRNQIQGIEPPAYPCKSPANGNDTSCGLTLNGRTIGSQKTATMAACSELCAHNSSCAGWQWNFPNNSNSPSMCMIASQIYGLSLQDMTVHPAWVGSKGYKKSGACTAIWTGLTDIEAECDGFLTYDRRESKYDESQIREAIEGLKSA